MEGSLSVDFSTPPKVKNNFLVESVDAEVKEPVFVDFTVCLLVGVHILSKQTFQLTGFVMY